MIQWGWVGWRRVREAYTYTRSIQQANNKQFYLIYAAEKCKGELCCLSVDGMHQKIPWGASSGDAPGRHSSAFSKMLWREIQRRGEQLMMLWTVVLRGQVLCSSYQKIYGVGASTLSHSTNILLTLLGKRCTWNWIRCWSRGKNEYIMVERRPSLTATFQQIYFNQLTYGSITIFQSTRK